MTNYNILFSIAAHTFLALMLCEVVVGAIECWKCDKQLKQLEKDYETEQGIF